MGRLPKPIWISLQETLDLVVDKTKKPQEVVKPRLVEAFIDEVIETTGDCRSLEAGPHITGSVWRSADVSWADNALNPGLYETEKAVETPEIKSPIDLLPSSITYVEDEFGEKIRGVLRVIKSSQFDQVQVRREDVVRWLDPDEAPAGEDEAPAGEDEARTTIKEKSKTGGKRKRKGSVDAILKNRIESVLAQARRKWADPMSRPTPYAMAKSMCNAEVGGMIENFSEDTVKKILGGTYPTIERLNITPLS